MQWQTRRASYRAWLTASATGAALVIGAASQASAQTEQAAQPNKSTTEVEAIIVTAQRRSENIQNVPVSVQALSAKEIQALGIKQSTDIGQVTPNVTMALPDGAGNQPLISIRGIGINDYDTNNAGPNGVYLDDVYISAPAAQTFAVFDLSQIEVLKGPQGTLYGRNTSGGALVFTSNKPTDQFTADFHFEYSSFNTLQVEGAVGGPITDKLDGRISFVVNESDGFMHNSLTDEPASGANNQAVRLQLLYRPTDKLKIAFNSTIGYVHNLPTEYRHIGDFAPGTQNTANPTVCSVAQAYAGGCVDLFGYGTPKGFYDGSFSRMQELHVLNLINSLRVDYDLGPIALTSITAYQHSDKSFPEDTDGGPDDLVQATYGVKSDTYTQEFRAAENSKVYNWVAGLYYLHENLDQNQPLSLFYNGDQFGGFGISPGPGAFDGVAELATDKSHQVTDSVALYGQGDYNYHKFTLTLGGRYTYERKTFSYFGGAQFQDDGVGEYGPLTDIITANESQTASNFTWRAALSYHVTDRILTYASVATGFKSGDFNGSFLSNVPAQAALQLKPVAPENVTAYEIGAKSSFFERRLIVNGAVFYNQYNDEQIFANVPVLINLPGVGPTQEETEILTNAQRAHTEGVELQVTAVPIHGLTIDLQPAWLNAQIDHAGIAEVAGTVPLDGKQLANAPKFSFSGLVNYKIPVWNNDDIDLQFNSSYKSHQFFDSTNDPYTQQAGYWIHNLNLTYQSHKGWEVGVYIKNLTNTQYLLTAFDETSPFGFIEGVVGTPRTYGGQFTYHY